MPRKSPVKHKVRRHSRRNGRVPVNPYIRGHGNPKPIVTKRKISKHIPKTVLLWHGSPMENKDLILKYGIQYRRPQVEKMISEATKEIQRATEVKRFAKNGVIRQRIMEATEKGGVVFLSADRDYTMQNALAGKEWYASLLQRALANKLKELYKERRNVAEKKQKLMKKLDLLRKKTNFALERGDHTEYEHLRKVEKVVTTELNKISQEYIKIRKKVYEAEQEQEKKLISRTAVLFKIEMPYFEFKRLAGSKSQKEQIQRFEELVKEGHPEERIKRLRRIGKEKISPYFEFFFSEVHMKRIPPKYITVYGTFEKPRPGEKMSKPHPYQWLKKKGYTPMGAVFKTMKMRKVT